MSKKEEEEKQFDLNSWQSLYTIIIDDSIYHEIIADEKIDTYICWMFYENTFRDWLSGMVWALLCLCIIKININNVIWATNFLKVRARHHPI